MDILKIINDYKHLNLPLDMVARNNNVSTGFVLNTLHYFTVVRPKEIRESKKLLKELS